MKRFAGLALIGASLACGSGGPQLDDDTANDHPPAMLAITSTVRDDCGIVDPGFDGPYVRRRRDDGGFDLYWDATVAWAAHATPTFPCERSGDEFSCWPTPQSQKSDGGFFPTGTVTWLRGTFQGDTLTGEVAYRVTCDSLDATCVIDDTGGAVQAPCESVFAFEGYVPEVQGLGRCPAEELVPVGEPAEVVVYNFTGATLYGRVTTPDGLAPVAVASAVGPYVLNAWQGGHLVMTGDSMSDEDCSRAVLIDAPLVFVELRGKL